ncbi:MAG: Inositol 2-dehydrogenase/D-chiro-inositol 3-dehydrogenase [bacterium]|nr:Inositol 2-dehydrogenase/D-chiro-inositol 3-dehydrogenase [bacterium]
MKRRQFLRDLASSGAGAGLAVMGAPLLLSTNASAAEANERISVAVIGIRGRGNGLLKTFRSRSDVEIRYLCDVDSNVLSKRTEETEKDTGHRPKAIKDFREALDDPAVHAVVLGTPDHWHAIPTIMACRAGKDVYVEKPDGHNILEGRTMVEAQRKYQRVVQLGTQWRSTSHLLSAMEYIRSGNLGKVRLAKAWESARQGTIGKPADTEPPEGVDYDFWLGPAPKRPFNPKRFHSTWRWFFDYGTGDLGNDGVHRLDKALRSLQEAARAEGRRVPLVPHKVAAMGGKLYYDDAQEWPDTQLVTYQFEDFVLSYELRLWSPTAIYGLDGEGAAVFGDNGYLVFNHNGWRAFDADENLVKEDSSEDSEMNHVADFLDCVRSRTKPNADLETVGHPSSLLCHLGNVAWRAGEAVALDPTTYTFGENDAANQFLTRPVYREPWVLPELSKV